MELDEETENGQYQQDHQAQYRFNENEAAYHVADYHPYYENYEEMDDEEEKM